MLLAAQDTARQPTLFQLFLQLAADVLNDFPMAASLLYVGIIPQPIQPCTATGPSCSGDGMTIFGGLPLPFLSLAIFVAIIILLLLVRRRIHS